MNNAFGTTIIVVTAVLAGIGIAIRAWLDSRKRFGRPIVTCRAFPAAAGQPLSVEMSKKDVKLLRSGSPIRIPLTDLGLPQEGHLIIVHSNGMNDSRLLPSSQFDTPNTNPRLVFVNDEWLKTLPTKMDLDGVEITLHKAA